MVSLQRERPETQAFAIPLRMLEDFSPRFIEATPTIPAHVLSDCPTCGEPPGLELASGGLRVGQTISKPRRFTWYCHSHDGGARGIMASLSDHETEMSNLRIEKKVYIPKLDTDTTADHQKAYKCSAPRRLTIYRADLGRATSTHMPCKKCSGCRDWRRAHRISQLEDKVCRRAVDLDGDDKKSNPWESVQITPALSPSEYAAMSRRLRRDNSEFAGVPTASGRVILTDSSLPVGRVIPTENVLVEIETLVALMIDSGRISGTAATRKPREKKEVTGQRIGLHNLDQASEARVYSEYGCPKVGERRGPGREWDVSVLSPDELLGLWTALGIRVWRGRR